MMGKFLILATEAHGEGGFGINFDIFETNLINLAILVGVLLYFAPKVLGNILNERRAKIAEAVQEAEGRVKKAAEALADQQQKLTQAQTEAERIRKAAEERAQLAKAEIATQAEKDIERMKSAAAQDLNSEQERVIAELRRRVVALSMERVENRLKSELDASAQQKLVERSLAQLG
jgi:F-type H+-transporting ATPase subunit b